MRHKAKVLTKEEVEQGRSSAYKYLDLDFNNKTKMKLTDKMKEHINEKFKYLSQETLDRLQEEEEFPQNLTEEQELYLTDEMYLPIHYKGMIVKEPFFEGKGNHSVAQLEAICEQFQEYCHQQSVIKHNCMKHIVELKFSII